MRIVDLYRYNQDGEVIVTPNPHNESDKVSLYRVVADEGMLITNGDIETCAFDTENPEEWTEIVDKNYIPYEENEVSEDGNPNG